MIGIDVGGANLKIADENGVILHYCPLWQEAPLKELLLGHRDASAGKAAVVMSGELADCFPNKKEGISFIVDQVREAFPDALFYGTDGKFHDRAAASLAAANWLASADHLRTRYPRGLLVDMGSTTIDVVPLSGFETLKGLTDLDRLQKGYLIYHGLLRTPVATLVGQVRLNNIPTPVSTEFFAQSADAHIVLGHISSEEYTCDTPDRKERDVLSASRRLARVVCADLDEIGMDGAYQVALSFWEEQKRRIREGILAAGGDPENGESTPVLYAGIGSRLLLRQWGGIDLAGVIGSYADALPAYAVREVALRDRIF
ncbi:putative H4MPT-linked C1 transfer pathway protein [Methanolinea mesophila]|uniref:hydantoinase/oxoprolinase family protein n=1 Tax=Methanolinea mesophila TaxID=547055 RepID=UPI001AE90D6B|nr:hydantoinase/oxoprolinase family protein [Methanolinea mesophila]MBP1928203.1 putative H4MPT-linked C1 transfer pathway protein [Methanolinea mesophila]